MRTTASLTALALALTGVHAARAQSILDAGLRVGPQIHSYSIGAPTNETITEYAVPVFAIVPITSAFSIDVGTAFASSHVQQTSATPATTSDIKGLTDTQIRGTYTIGQDFVVLTAGVNLPTGSSTITSDQQVAAGLIGNDFLAFPISNMGTGFGGTGAIAIARPLGDNWNLGFGASMRYSGQYDPFAAPVGASVMHYQPGNEYRGRIGVDRAFGTGRLTLGFTYSKFANDQLGPDSVRFIYNTGDRYITQASVSNTVGAGDLWFAGWNLYRTAGTLADSSYLGHENIASGAMGYSIPGLGGRIDPSVEVRHWLQAGSPSSILATMELAARWSAGGIGISPSAGYTLGHLAAQTTTGVSTTASLSGFHAALIVRLR